MKVTTVDSLAAVEALLALEEQLDGPLRSRFPDLKAFLVTPFEARCTDGGAVSHVWVVARYGQAVLFASLETASFGVGSLTEGVLATKMDHCPTIESAARSFLDAVKEEA